MNFISFISLRLNIWGFPQAGLLESFCFIFVIDFIFMFFVNKHIFLFDVLTFFTLFFSVTYNELLQPTNYLTGIILKGHSSNFTH